MRKKHLLIAAFASLALFSNCKKSPKRSGPLGEPATVADATTSVSVTRTEKFQNIDGFGFFGAQHVWWGASSQLYSDAWAKDALTDLGVTIWRNELYPPAT